MTSLSRFLPDDGTLQSGGMTMIDSMQIARDVMGNVVLEGEVKKAEEKNRAGKLAQCRIEAVEMDSKADVADAGCGRRYRKMEVIFQKIADMYEEQLEKSLDKVMALTQPVILVFRGLLLGW